MVIRLLLSTIDRRDEWTYQWCVTRNNKLKSGLQDHTSQYVLSFNSHEFDLMNSVNPITHNGKFQRKNVGLSQVDYWTITAHLAAKETPYGNRDYSRMGAVTNKREGIVMRPNLGMKSSNMVRWKMNIKQSKNPLSRVFNDQDDAVWKHSWSTITNSASGTKNYCVNSSTK